MAMASKSVRLVSIPARLAAAANATGGGERAAATGGSPLDAPHREARMRTSGIGVRVHQCVGDLSRQNGARSRRSGAALVGGARRTGSGNMHRYSLARRS
jgi:hypothetical protein